MSKLILRLASPFALSLTASLIGVLLLSGSSHPTASRKPITSTHPPNAHAPAAPPSDYHVHERPGSIVGSDTPHLIPTHVAAGLFLRTIAMVAERDATEGSSLLWVYLDHLQTQIAIELTLHERNHLILVATEYHASTQSPRISPDQFQHQRPAIAEASWQRLGLGVRPEVASALQRHLDVTVKRNVKILK